MEKFEIYGYEVEIDRESTVDWYAQADPWGCSCGHCRNFLAHAGSPSLPDFVIELLNKLEIPPEKATYVSELYTDSAGIHYQFSYRIAGKILKEHQTDEAEPVRCCHEIYPYGAPGFPEPHFDLEFWICLPWILK